MIATRPDFVTLLVLQVWLAFVAFLKCGEMVN